MHGWGVVHSVCDEERIRGVLGNCIIFMSTIDRAGIQTALLLFFAQKNERLLAKIGEISVARNHNQFSHQFSIFEIFIDKQKLSKMNGTRPGLRSSQLVDVKLFVFSTD